MIPSGRVSPTSGQRSKWKWLRMMQYARIRIGMRTAVSVITARKARKSPGLWNNVSRWSPRLTMCCTNPSGETRL